MFDSRRDVRESLAIAAGGGSQPQCLPDGLAGMAPGAELGSMLAGIDPLRVDDGDRVVLLSAWHRQLSHIQAAFYQAMSALVEASPRAEDVADGTDPVETTDLAASEVRAALGWTRRAAETQLDLALALTERSPVFEALHGGLIDLPKARVLIDHTVHLEEPLARRVLEVALEQAPGETTGQLRARIQKLAISIDPESSRRRYLNRLVDRRVLNQMTEAGTANLMGLDLPAADANAAMNRLDEMARGLKNGGDSRPIDQIRADLFLDLLNGRLDTASTGRRGVVDIRVDLATLARLDDEPAEIPGWGPVVADIARKVAREQQEAEWRATVTGDNGEVAHVVTTKRRPTKAQRRRIEAVTMTCVFPGCRMPAQRSDIDHRNAWTDGGPTQEDNLQPLCRHDHRLKHAGWKLEELETGEYLWTSPLGLKYTVDPRAP